MDMGRVLRGLRVIGGRCRGRIHIVYLSIAYPAVQLGENVFVGNCRLLATDGGAIAIGSGASVGVLARVEAKGGAIDIGRDSFIGQGTIIICRSRISIGAKALIAEYVTIRDQDHEFEAGKPAADSGMRIAPIQIGDNVWIGAKATITRGVSIGDNAVIGANSVVTRDVPENAVVCGVPARILRLHSDPASSSPRSGERIYEG